MDSEKKKQLNFYQIKKKNIKVEYILNDNESHYFRDPAKRLAFYKKLELFLDKYLHPDKY